MTLTSANSNSKEFMKLQKYDSWILYKYHMSQMCVFHTHNDNNCESISSLYCKLTSLGIEITQLSFVLFFHHLCVCRMCMCVCVGLQNWLWLERRQAGRLAVVPKRQDSAEWAILQLQWRHSHTHSNLYTQINTHTHKHLKFVTHHMAIKLYFSHPAHWSE